jgi:hypothetical protein
MSINHAWLSSFLPEPGLDGKFFTATFMLTCSHAFNEYVLIHFHSRLRTFKYLPSRCLRIPADRGYLPYADPIITKDLHLIIALVWEHWFLDSSTLRSEARWCWLRTSLWYSRRASVISWSRSRALWRTSRCGLTQMRTRYECSEACTCEDVLPLSWYWIDWHCAVGVSKTDDMKNDGLGWEIKSSMCLIWWWVPIAIYL